MELFYTDEKNVLIVISLLKKYGIKNVIASPGTTNVTFVGSLQHDPFFYIYSAADERSAAYMACGLAEETNEPVVITCTGATASRNYVPGLTEAYYRKLPVLAITATQNPMKIGHHIPQIIDRSVIQNDIAKYNLTVSYVHDAEEEWACQANVNKAILELYRNGGGPVLLNLETRYCPSFSTKNLPNVKKIERITFRDKYPNIKNGNIAIYVGAHKKWTDEETVAVDRFCENNNAVVFCDQTSNYKGKYRILRDVLFYNYVENVEISKISLMIHIGNISSGQCYYAPQEVWRVNPDGEVRDTFQKLTNVFEMEEQDFFEYYANNSNGSKKTTYYELCKSTYDEYVSKLQDLPFSNVWIAQQLSKRLPENSVLHLGIINTLRSWNIFEIPSSVLSYSNTGGFGIDGDVSSMIGASLANQNKLYYCVLGDLAFFYDMNSIGNHVVGNNVRILVINNGRGTEFRLNGNPAAKFGEDADLYMAAAGHYGNKSQELLKHYAEDLGFEYMSCSNKDEFSAVCEKFVNPVIGGKPILFEVFTESKNETLALDMVKALSAPANSELKKAIKNVLGDQTVNKIKKIIRK